MTEARRPRTQTVASVALQPLIFVLHERGIDPRRLLNGLDVRLEALTDLRSRIDLDQYRAIWHQAIGLTGDAALGVHVGLRSEPSAFGPLGYVLTNAKDCRSALLLWNQYSRLILDAPLFELHTSDGVAAISVARTSDASPESVRPMTEFVMFSLLRIAVFLSNIDPGHTNELIGLQFRHGAPEPQVIAQYEVAAGGSRICFAASANRILFNAGFLDRPVAYADPEMLGFMIRRSDALMRALAVEDDLRQRVRSAIRRRLAGTAPTLAAVAQDCNMSRASLQRRLAALSSGFQPLLDEVRKDFAREVLDGPASSIEELAFLLGYASSSAFHHAFKRWTGMTPAEYRARERRSP